MNNNVEVLAQSLETIKVGAFGVNVETMTSPKMNKGGRCGVEPNPYFGRVTKRTIYKNTLIGCDYENCVNNAANRKSEGSGVMESEKASGKTKVSRYISVSDKDPNQFYLDVPIRAKGGTKIESVFFVDGKEATKKQMEVIKTYLPAEYESQKQLAVGLVGAEQIQYRSIKIENVVAIRCGNNTIYPKSEAQVEVA